MKKKKYFRIVFLFSFIVALILLSGCAKQETPAEKSAAELCVKACNEAKQTKPLDTGPCLLDPIPQNPDWVCDVAHSPRELIDNQPENQCSTFRSGTANHFIEVTPECGVVRAV